MSRAASREGEAGTATDPGAPELPDFFRLLHRVPVILYNSAQGVDGTWRYVSGQIEAILGYTPAEWCADPTLWRRCLHPDDAPRILADESNSGLDGGGGLATEYRMLHRDGRVVWVRDEAQLVREADGVEYWHGVLSDVSERKRTELRLERAAAQHAAVAALGEHALEGSSAAELADEAVEVAVDLLDIDIGILSLLSRDGERLEVTAVRGVPLSSFASGLAVTDDTQPGYAVRHGQVVVSDWETEARFRRSPVVARSGVRSGLSIVVEGRRGRFGVLGLHSRRQRAFSQIEIDFAQAIANVLGDALERQLTEDDIRHRALHDPLTGLPNRALFMDRLAHALQRLRRRECRAAVLFLDIDRFQLINESLGHDVGDELLSAVAPRMKQALRGTDTVARFGADSFAILLEEIAGEQDAIEMTERVAAVFTRPFLLAGDEHFVTASVGISLATGGERAEDLVRDAEAATHRAKERGRARYELFDERIRGRAMTRLRVESDLRWALERDEFTLEYQPIVRLRPRGVVGVEALLRWNHPRRGRISPLEFIPIAEETGLIEPIGRWVLEQACRQAAAWCTERPDDPPLTVAVNLSAVQLESRTLVDVVAEAVRGARLDPTLLALELTETIMMAESEDLFRALADLKAIGVALVLDDFGTGYSSLGYLTRLPLDVLKVDRSFVDGLGIEPRDTAITEAIIAMSQALSLSVIGEGVETALQLAELQRLGCETVQGFYFSPPVPAAAVTELRAASWARTGS